MRVFYSHSFAVDLEPKVDFFRSLLKQVKMSIEKETEKALTVDIVEGDTAGFSDPVRTIFPEIRNSDIVFAVLLDEIATGPRSGFVSAACLQEIIVGHQAGKNMLAWVEHGCADRLGFARYLTTYSEFSLADLLSEEGKNKIAKTIRKRLLEYAQPIALEADSYLYCNTFDEGSPHNIHSLVWPRISLISGKSEEILRSGGQSILQFAGEHGGGCLAIASTRDTWNWFRQAGQSITTLGHISEDPFAHGQRMSFEIRCRSSGPVRVRPTFNGPAVDPDDPANKDKHDWPLVDLSRSPEWNWKTVTPEEKWVSKTFRCSIDYREGNVLQDPVKLYLVADTADEFLFIDKILLAVAS